MITDENLPVAARLSKLLAHLGIERAHFGAQLATELSGLLMENPTAVASLTLPCPTRIDPAALAPLADRVLVFTGERGPQADVVARARPRLPDARLITFDDYFVAGWTDIAPDRADAIVEATTAFLSGIGGATVLTPRERRGEIAGITYRIEGSGPALVLMPLFLAPSQWEPLIEALSRHFCVVVLSGPALGIVAMLESRGTADGYLRVVQSVVDAMAIKPGDSILDVGCGTGALDRWLANYTERANPITAVDVNAYLRREAEALAAKAGVDDVISFGEGNAEALPFADASFDATMSHTVMEEADADAMLAEMVRVTKPGGCIGVNVRAVDMNCYWNIDLPPDLKAKVETPVRSVAEKGCADASLYSRFRAAGLQDLKLFPHIMTSDDPGSAIWQYYEPFVLSLLDEDDIPVWDAAKARGIENGTLFFGRPHHCAVGTKPR